MPFPIPSNDEIAAEIATLTEMQPKVRWHSAFGDDNRAAIEAQINVLQNRMTDDDIYDEYEDPEDPDNRHALDNALEAWAWLNGESEEGLPPSADWQSLVKD